MVWASKALYLYLRGSGLQLHSSPSVHSWGSARSSESQSLLLSDIASDGRWLITRGLLLAHWQGSAPFYKGSFPFVKECFSCCWWGEALQAVVNIETQSYWVLYIFIRSVVLHMSLKGINRTTKTTSGAERKDLPLIHWRGNIFVHVTPLE